MAHRYEEVVSFSPVVQILYVVLLGVFVSVQLTSVPRFWWVPVLVGVALLVLPALFGRLVILVDEGALTATFGFFGWPQQRVPLSEITGAHAVSYRPIRQFGGWGIRVGTLEGQRTSVYSVRGDRGVVLELARPRRISGFETSRFLIGTAEPERLLAALGEE